MKGTVFKRSPGVFLIAIDHGRDAKGKRIRKWNTFKGTKREAQDECATSLSQPKRLLRNISNTGWLMSKRA
jgi:hypothetical protein